MSVTLCCLRDGVKLFHMSLREIELVFTILCFFLSFRFNMELKSFIGRIEERAKVRLREAEEAARKQAIEEGT